MSKQDVDQLVLKVLEVQEIRKKMHQIQEELNWERQNFESAHSQGKRMFSFSSTWMIKYRKQSERSNNCQKTSTAKIQLTSTEFLFFKVKS